MICPSCKKENKPDSRFCKFCGSPIVIQFKTCENGHNFESTLDKCPYCPQNQQQLKEDLSLSSAKTVLDKATGALSKAAEISSVSAEDKVEQASGLMVGDKDKVPHIKTLPEIKGKLVGWLVSFDLHPDGVDFRITDTRLKIGKSSTNDVVINDNSISDEHAIIVYKDKTLVMQDLLSSTGTFLNNVPVEQRVTLKDNDKIKIGNINFLLKLI
jgi:pSer/pThr/pTyr-binding forkhead associated (FHA) protein